MKTVSRKAGEEGWKHQTTTTAGKEEANKLKKRNSRIRRKRETMGQNKQNEKKKGRK